MTMFCYQCEQTAGGTGCTVQGACGKDPQTAALQDLLLYAVKDIARYAHCARTMGAKDRRIDVFVIEALFSAVTNVNFDPLRLQAIIKEGVSIRDNARALCRDACAKAGKQCVQLETPIAWWTRTDDLEDLVREAREVTIRKRIDDQGPDVAGLQELVTYGLKGMAAYADHAQILGKEDEQVYAFFHEALAFLAGEPGDTEALLKMALRCGEINLKVMGLLDAAHTAAFGHPQPTKVRVTPRAGRAIAVSGHDLKDLEELLKQTVGSGVNVYTHGEMLPAHGYPGLRKFPHLAGNYGGAWQDQRKEFDAFPGSILMTTNCIQRPTDGYKSRIFTSGLVAWAGVRHISDRNFRPLIEAAEAAEGFAKDAPEKYVTVGFAHDAVMKVADKIVAAVKSGAIRRFFLIGGCDGAKPGRNYYTEFAQAVPKDCLILTLACGKYRFNKLDFGEIGGIGVPTAVQCGGVPLPRLLDCGQCNDAYSAIQIALALAKAFNCGVNDLPLTLVLSWYEQEEIGWHRVGPGGGDPYILQTGGMHLARIIYVGYMGSKGAYQLQGGSLNAQVKVGDFFYAYPGRFDQTGGKISGSLDVNNGVYSMTGGSADLDHLTSTGRVELRGGNLSARVSEFLYSGASSTIAQSAGVNSTGYLEVSDGARYELTGGSLVVDGGLNLKPGAALDLAGCAPSLSAAGSSLVNLSHGGTVNAQAATLTIGPNSLLILAAGSDPNGPFKKIDNAGMTHVAGTTLSVPHGGGFSGWGEVEDFVDCQGAVTPRQDGWIDLNGGVMVSSGGSVDMGYGVLTVPDAHSGLSSGTLISHYLAIGSADGATFTQTGGQCSCQGGGIHRYSYYNPYYDAFYGAFKIGHAAGTTGTYVLSGGMLACGEVRDPNSWHYHLGTIVGDSGCGNLIQTGGLKSQSSGCISAEVPGAAVCMP